jgi:DNA-binding response OmpR family regulator
VRADEARLRQILTNLVGNALKFVPFGVIEVSVAFKGEMAEISVSDTGVGIKSDDVKRIFNAFEQGEGSDSRAYGGTGLGLAICRKLVDLQGGSISVDSDPGKSTTFVFTLPFDRSGGTDDDQSVIIRQGSVPAEGIPAIHAAETIPGDQNLQVTTNASILIVEDDPISRKILCESLSLLKYKVHSAHNGIDAFEKMSGEKYDLVLLDVMMPGLSGYELLKRIRIKLSPEELPVILVTAKSQLDDIHAGFKAGANDYIIKPFSMDELSIRVENMLKLKKVLPPEEPGLVIREKGSIRIIPYSKIIYLSSIGKRTVIHTTDHDETASILLKDFEIKLPGSFIRIHKQHIIHSFYLSGLIHIGSGRYEAILNDADDTHLVVGRSFVSTIKEYIGDRERDTSSVTASSVRDNISVD